MTLRIANLRRLRRLALADRWGGLVLPSGPPTLGALLMWPFAGTVGAAFSATIYPSAAGSTIALSGPGAAGLTVSGSGSSRTVSGTLTGTGAIDAVETLAGAGGSPRTTNAVGLVAAALGPTTGSISTTLGGGLDVVTLTGLAAGEKVDALSPSDGRFVLNTTGIKVVRGMSGVTPGDVTLTLTTNYGRVLSVVVTISAPALTGLTLSPSTLTTGEAYSGTISGATAGSTIALTGAAAGLTVSGSGATRTVSGTPTAAGVLGATETFAPASNSPRTSSNLGTINEAVTLAALALAPAVLTVGIAYSGTLSNVTAGSSVALTGASAGLSVSGSGTTRTVSGTPTEAGALGATETLSGATNSPRTTSGLTTVLSALGLSGNSFQAGAASPTLIGAFTGLGSGESVTSFTPNDGRLALASSGTVLVVGLSTSSAGSISATFTTSLGRTLSRTITVEAAATGVPALASGSKPSATGSFQEGGTGIGDPGNWLGSPTELEAQWLLDETNVPLAVYSTQPFWTDDVGKTPRLGVRARNAFGWSEWQYSDPLPAIIACPYPSLPTGFVHFSLRDVTTFAVNANGTGGSPAGGAKARRVSAKNDSSKYMSVSDALLGLTYLATGYNVYGAACADTAGTARMTGPRYATVDGSAVLPSAILSLIAKPDAAGMLVDLGATSVTGYGWRVSIEVASETTSNIVWKVGSAVLSAAIPHHVAHRVVLSHDAGQATIYTSSGDAGLVVAATSAAPAQAVTWSDQASYFGDDPLPLDALAQDIFLSPSAPSSGQRDGANAYMRAGERIRPLLLPFSTAADTVTTAVRATTDTTLPVTSASGFNVGDTLIVHVSTAPGTVGPGGALPLATGATETAIGQTNVDPNSDFIRSLADGKVSFRGYAGNRPSAETAALPSIGPYLANAIPQPFIAKVLNKGGTGNNTITFDRPFTGPVPVGSVVSVDCSPAIEPAWRAMTHGSRFFTPAGSFQQASEFKKARALERVVFASVTLGATTMRKPDGLPGRFFAFEGFRELTFDIKTTGNHRGAAGVGVDGGSNGSKLSIMGGGVVLKGCRNYLVRTTIKNHLNRGFVTEGTKAGHPAFVRPFGRGFTPFRSPKTGLPLDGLAILDVACDYADLSDTGAKIVAQNEPAAYLRIEVTGKCTALTKVVDEHRCKGLEWDVAVENGAHVSDTCQSSDIALRRAIYTDRCRDITVPQPIASEVGWSVVYNAGNVSDVIEAKGNKIALGRGEIRGWIDSTGVPPRVALGASAGDPASEHNSDGLVLGTYGALLADDGLRDGLFVAPPGSALRAAVLDYDTKRTTVQGVRFVDAPGYPGAATSGLTPVNVRVHPTDRTGSALVDVIADAVDLASPGTQTRVVTNSAYRGNGWAGTLVDISLPPATADQPYRGFLAGKRDGTTIAVSGPGWLSLNGGSSSSWFVTGTPPAAASDQTVTVTITETPPTGSPRVTSASLLIKAGGVVAGSELLRRDGTSFVLRHDDTSKITLRAA